MPGRRLSDGGLSPERRVRTAWVSRPTVPFAPTLLRPFSLLLPSARPVPSFHHHTSRTEKSDGTQKSRHLNLDYPVCGTVYSHRTPYCESCGVAYTHGTSPSEEPLQCCARGSLGTRRAGAIMQPGQRGIESVALRSPGQTTDQNRHEPLTPCTEHAPRTGRAHSDRGGAARAPRGILSPRLPRHDQPGPRPTRHRSNSTRKPPGQLDPALRGRPTPGWFPRVLRSHALSRVDADRQVSQASPAWSYTPADRPPRAAHGTASDDFRRRDDSRALAPVHRSTHQTHAPSTAYPAGNSRRVIETMDIVNGKRQSPARRLTESPQRSVAVDRGRVHGSRGGRGVRRGWGG